VRSRGFYLPVLSILEPYSAEPTPAGGRWSVLPNWCGWNEQTLVDISERIYMVDKPLVSVSPILKPARDRLPMISEMNYEVWCETIWRMR
jgi:hypothetical protein